MPWPPVQPRAPRASTDLDGSSPKGIGALPWQPPIFFGHQAGARPWGGGGVCSIRTPPSRVTAGLPPTPRVFIFQQRSDGTLTFPATSTEDGEGWPGAVPTATGTQQGGKPIRNLHPPAALPPPAVPALPLRTARLLGMPDEHKKKRNIVHS